MRRYLINFDLKRLPVYYCDLLIIGGGIAGLTAALITGDELDTVILTKGRIKQSSTWFAQGGIAAAVGEGDSSDSHFEDTLTVGGHLSNRQAVKVVVEEARDAIDFLLDLGTKFDRDNGKLRLAREGGHSRPRVLHAGDGTGSVIAATLGKAASTKKKLSLKQDRFVIDLLTDGHSCAGALVYDTESSSIEVYAAPATLLATGGMGQIFESTTNPVLATGDGFAMAIRAGAVMDALEFIQFHPTAFHNNRNPRFLISEALRGEGAYLRDGGNQRFMVGVHELAELAPRDIVCREMVSVMKREGTDHVYLDATTLGRDALKSRFPGIYKYLKEHGYDLGTDLVPVSPAAHYMIGGVKTDLNGRTSISGLYASGEVASTGVHGANRLASNSLLEGLVFSRRATEIILNRPAQVLNKNIDFRFSGLSAAESPDLGDIRNQLRMLMQDKVGIIRDGRGLTEAREQITFWLDSLAGSQFNNPGAWETQNMLRLSQKIIDSALTRTESVGAHYRVS